MVKDTGGISSQLVVKDTGDVDGQDSDEHSNVVGVGIEEGHELSPDSTGLEDGPTELHSQIESVHEE